MEPESVQPSISAKIAQCVEHGSPFLGLQENYFSAEELMIWLKDQEITITTQVAYKALCTKILPKDQYLPDESSLLAHRPGYVLMSTDLDILEVNTRKDGCGPPIRGVFVRAHLNNEFDVIEISIISQALNGQINSPKTLALTYAGRHFPHVRLDADSINSALLATDWMEKVRYNNQLYALLLNRVTQLQTTAPDYYAKVAYKHYYQVARKIYRDNLLTEITQEGMSTFNTFFPSIVNPRLLEYSTLAFNISLLASDLAGYVLGFPIQTGLPSSAQIADALDHLETMGLKEYTDHIAKYSRASQLPLSTTPFESENKATICNEKDVLMVKADKYSPFDVVVYRSGEHIFRFTRPEFSNLLKTKKNPWNKEEIPHSVLSTMAARRAASKDMGLPKAKTLKKILRSMEVGKLFSSGVYVVPPTTQGVRDVLAGIMPILADQTPSTWGLPYGPVQLQAVGPVQLQAVGPVQLQAVGRPVGPTNGDMIASMTATRGTIPPSMAAPRSAYSTSSSPAINQNRAEPAAADEVDTNDSFEEYPHLVEVDTDDSSEEDYGPPPVVEVDTDGPPSGPDHRFPPQQFSARQYAQMIMERVRALLQESSDSE